MMIILAIIIPLIGALAVLMTGKQPQLRNILLVAIGVINLLLVSLIVMQRAEIETILLWQTLPGLNVAFHVEPLGLIFAMTAGVLWPITSIYAIGYLNALNDAHQTRFHALFCVAISCAMGIAFAENLFTLFIFYEILTFSTWPLVTHSRTEKALAAGRIYLGILLVTSICLFLLAIILVGFYGSSLSFTPGGVLQSVPSWLVTVLCLLFLFGIGKAAVMPFHRWLPNAMVAPAPVSALLHAVAVVKAGVFSFLKISIYIFGVDSLSEINFRELILWIPAITLLLSSLIAMRQDDIKARLAYSTISQLSYIILGALLANELAILGSSMHITMHAFGKITLFFCAGAIAICAGKYRVSELNGLGRSMPWTFAAFLIATLSIAGLPPVGGVWSKWFLALGTLEAGQLGLLIVLMVSTLLNVYYLAAIPVRAFFLSSGDVDRNLETRPSLIIPLVVTAGVSICLFLVADQVADLAREIMT